MKTYICTECKNKVCVTSATTSSKTKESNAPLLCMWKIEKKAVWRKVEKDERKGV